MRRDLFDEDNAGWVADVGLLEKLVAEKLESAAAEVRAEGWKWTEIRSSFSWDDRKRPFDRTFKCVGEWAIV